MRDLARAPLDLGAVPLDRDLLALYAEHHLPFAAGRQGVPGVDYAWAKPSVPALRSAGEVFVAQYFSPDESKDLTPARADALLSAGIKLVVIYEYGAQDARRGKPGGERDATAAEAQAKACGVDGIPIYWAVDYDAPPGDQAAINGYSDGWATVLGNDRGRNPYGGYWPLSRLRAAGKATRLWGTPAWSGAEWATSGLRPDIMQGAVVTIGGVQCDLDAGLSADFGQWPRPSAPALSWQWHTCNGNESFAAVARHTGMSVAHILRATCSKNGGHWDAGTFDGLNYDLGDPVENPHRPLAAGTRLWVLA